MNETAATLPIMEVFSRPGCHLCEQLIDELLPLIRGRFTLEIRNIDADPRWQQQFGHLIPVLCVNGQEICHYTLDKAAILALCGTIQAS